MKIFQNLNFVLVETSHPGNIGACARAMNSMDISNLSLVNPKDFPSKESEARAKSGKKVLDQANIHKNLNEAINTSNLVIGTSARSRSMPWPMMEINDLGKVINESLARKEKVSIVFGNEAVGLDNEDLGKCDFHLQIPTSEDSSLNLSHAVQIVAYEIYKGSSSLDLSTQAREVELASSQQKEKLIEHIELVLESLDFYDHQNPKQVPARLRRLIKRMQLDKLEIGILRGILSNLEQRLNK
jgi:tRNA (cytidine32/uridine32-2'-O)-methyltransferase